MTDTDYERDTDTPIDPETLQGEVAVLREENRRLRAEYARARASEYRRTALLSMAVGLAAIVGGVVAPGGRSVLFALGGTGVFVGVLTYYLTPERLQPAGVGRSIYETLARTESSIVAELGLGDERLYVPTPSAVRLYVPQHTAFEVPDADALDDVFVVGDDDRERGLAVEPTGDRLFERFEETGPATFGSDPESMARQLATALVEQFELLDSTDVDVGDQQVTVSVVGSAYGRLDRFDHPVPSLLASGLARGLDEPVATTVEQTDDEQIDAFVVCRWGERVTPQN